jgi:hypothetical protein
MNPKPKPEKRLKKPKKPVKKISSRGVLDKKARSLLRDIVMFRDKGCVCPAPEKGHSSIRQHGHLIPSTKGGTRFDLWNNNEQCHSCNGRHEYYPHYYTDWFLSVFGEEQYHRLCVDSDKIGLKSYELEEIIVQLEAIKAKQLTDPNFSPRFTQQEILSGSWRNK